MIATILVLLSISTFHFYWAFGGRFALDLVIPTKEGKDLFQPGKFITFMVAIVLLVFAIIIYLLGFYSSMSEVLKDYLRYAGGSISFIFILRAFGDFNAVGIFKKIKESDFAWYDTRFFSPASIILGLSIALIVYKV